MNHCCLHAKARKKGQREAAAKRNLLNTRKRKTVFPSLLEAL
jgi:hypothetical protein